MSIEEPKVGSPSPWGRIDHTDNLADGIVQVGTPSHGGIHLAAALNAAMPEVFRSRDGWYEEDCEWALVALIYPHAFDAKSQESAHKTVKNWMPDEYEAWSGVTLKPGESRKKDERTFLQAHANDWIAGSAYGSWHESVPKGWVGVSAHRPSSPPDEKRHFLVPMEEYDAPKDQSAVGFFVCDPLLHPTWDPDKPKGEQMLTVEAEEEQQERPRP